MNTKIKNYVDVLFKDIPSTKKAQELKEEILSTLNDHFEAHIAEGKSENQAYTEALADLGDIDELLKGLEPEKELKEKIDLYRTKRAKHTSIAVIMYILGIICVIAFGSISDFFGSARADLFAVIGVILSSVHSGKLFSEASTFTITFLKIHNHVILSSLRVSHILANSCSLEISA